MLGNKGFQQLWDKITHWETRVEDNSLELAHCIQIKDYCFTSATYHDATLIILHYRSQDETLDDSTFCEVDK